MIATLLIALMTARVAANDLEAAMASLDKLSAASISVDYQDETLKAVLADLESRVPVPLRADWESLERLGIHPDDRVTLRVNTTNAMTVLAGLALTIGDEYERPQFEEHAGQMVLTTLAATAPMRLTGVYDVRDLLTNAGLLKQLSEPAAVPAKPANAERHNNDDAAPDPEPDADPPVEPVPAPGDPPGGHRPRFGARLPKLPPMEDAEPRKMSPGERLFLLITDHVDPEAWMNFGGDRALVSELDGVLILTATPTIHRNFRAALEALRSANPASLSVDATIIELPQAELDRINRQSPTNSPAQLAALRTNPAARKIWNSASSVAMDARLELETAAGALQVRIVLAPRRDAVAGKLSIELETSIRQADEHRLVKTTLGLLPNQTGAALEVPGAKPGGPIQLLLLTINR